jgi:hypothetical protein
VVDHDNIPINHPDCGHRDYMRGCKSCIREFRRLTAAVPPARGNPDEMSDEELQDFYEFADGASDPEH